MTFGRAVGAGWCWLLACWLTWLAPLAHAEPDGTMLLDHAQGTVIVGGETVRGVLSLPYHWDAANPGQQGEAIFDFTFPLTQAPDDVWGIYLSALGNAYEIWLNGTLLQRHGAMARGVGEAVAHNGADAARAPRYVSIDAGHLRMVNQLRIHIRADIGRRGGLAPPLIGPQDAVYPVYLQAYRWSVTGSVGVVAFSLVVGLTALALWSSQIGLRRGGRLGGIRCICSPPWRSCSGRCTWATCWWKCRRCPGRGGACCRPCPWACGGAAWQWPAWNWPIGTV